MIRGKSTLEKFFPKLGQGSKSTAQSSSYSTSNDNENTFDSRKRVRKELSDNDVNGGQALLKSIDSYHVDVRDELRRRYLAKGPCQPYGHAYPMTEFSKIHRSFQDYWFKKFEWLEYSVSKDAAYCLWCYLLAQSDHKHEDNAFTKNGFKNWKKAIERFQAHEGLIDSPHNYAKIKCLGYNDQRHNVDYVMHRKSGQMEADYRLRLTAVVHVVSFLLEQGLTFCGHDESTETIHKGNFIELVKWYCERNEEVNEVMNSNALGNNQLTSPIVQKQIINACATEVRNFILEEIGDKWFSLLIDEARDSSVKEQMFIVLRFVNNQGVVMERFLGVMHVSDTSAQSLETSIHDFFLQGMDYQCRELGVKVMMEPPICVKNIMD